MKNIIKSGLVALILCSAWMSAFGSGFKLSNGLSIDNSGNVLINATGGLTPSIVTSMGFPLDANGNLLTNCAVGCSAGSMTWPLTPGIPVCTGTPCTAWGTTLTAPAGTIVGTTDTQALTNKTLDGVTPATMAFVDLTSSAQTQLNAKVGTGTTVNGHALSSNVTVSASDVTTGTLPLAQSFPGVPKRDGWIRHSERLHGYAQSGANRLHHGADLWLLRAARQQHQRFPDRPI